MKNTGKIRYIIRSFPAGVIYNKVNPVQEFTIIKDLKEGYDHEVTLDFQTGDYDVMVWSDLIQEGSETSCHIADDFGGIYLRDGYAGNNMYRDAFRGMATVSVPAEDGSKAELEIEMSRPLARFHLVSNDFVDFVDSNKADAPVGHSVSFYNKATGDRIYSTTVSQAGKCDFRFNLSRPFDLDNDEVTMIMQHGGKYYSADVIIADLTVAGAEVVLAE